MRLTVVITRVKSCKFNTRELRGLWLHYISKLNLPIIRHSNGMSHEFNYDNEKFFQKLLPSAFDDL